MTKFPSYFPGTISTLETFKATDRPRGLLTHAEEKWTNIKLVGLNLTGYFDKVKCVRVDKFKGPEDWLAAIQDFEVPPENVLAVGDSIKGDILAAHAVGVRYKVLIPTPWSVYNIGHENLPEGTIKVENIGQVVEAIINY